MCLLGVALCEAHPDLEVFRLRLGRAINFEYMEDSQVIPNSGHHLVLRT